MQAVKINLMEDFMEELINKMAEAIYIENYNDSDIIPYENASSLEKQGMISLAKAALAAIQEDYVLVRREAITAIDTANFTPHIDDLVQEEYIADAQAVINYIKGGDRERVSKNPL